MSTLLLLPRVPVSTHHKLKAIQSSSRFNRTKFDVPVMYSGPSTVRHCANSRHSFHFAPLLALVTLTGSHLFMAALSCPSVHAVNKQTCRAASTSSSLGYSEERTPRVAVIGGGLAGLAASVEILKRQGSVIIVEKCDRLGGNSAKASSGINAANSAPQKIHGISDSLEEFKDDTIRSGKGRSKEDMVEVLVKNSASAIDFLQEFGIDLSSIARLGGHSHPRTHRAGFDGKAMNVGYRIMSTLIKAVEQYPPQQFQVLKRTRALQLLTDGQGSVRGVRCETSTTLENGQESTQVHDVAADAVIMATGGFCADKSGLLSEYVPHLRDLATTNGPFATGDGVRMAIQAGAGLVDMEQVQLHPTGFVNPKDPSNPTKFLAPEALRGCGGILLNQQGVRFVNELQTRDRVVDAILKSCSPFPSSEASNQTLPVVAYLVLNLQGIQSFDKITADFYISRGLIQKFSNASQLSAALSLPEDAVRSTLLAYGHTEHGSDHPHEWHEGMHLASESTPKVNDSFGKEFFPSLFEPDEELYVAVVTPALHYCMGGVRFDSLGRVLTGSGTPISGLYAAGEVTGGVHGKNRLAGNSLLECVVFGRIAGEQSWVHTTEQAQCVA